MEVPRGVPLQVRYLKLGRRRWWGILEGTKPESVRRTATCACPPATRQRCAVCLRPDGLRGLSPLRRLLRCTNSWCIRPVSVPAQVPCQGHCLLVTAAAAAGWSWLPLRCSFGFPASSVPRFLRLSFLQPPDIWLHPFRQPVFHSIRHTPGFKSLPLDYLFYQTVPGLPLVDCLLLAADRFQCNN